MPVIILKNLELTEYLDDERLAFSKTDNEVWTLTPGQKEFKAAFHKRDALILRGPAGSGKTDITAREVLGLLKDGFADRILLTAPIDEGGEEIGFRKGDTFEKMLEHVNQYLEAFDGHLGQGDFRKGKKIRDALIAQGTIDIQPMGTLSGKNLRRTILIVDEAHKARMQHLLIAMTRLHTQGSKVIFSGDEKQHMSNGVSAFRAFTERFSDPAYADHIATIQYNADDIRRHPMTKLIVERGDDVPPGLAARMKEEEFTPERIKGLLTKHFDNVKNGRKDPMVEQVVRTYLSRQPEHVLLELMHQGIDTDAPEPGA
jgi:phosphate starvation-inducible PhoH-like protein